LSTSREAIRPIAVGIDRGYLDFTKANGVGIVFTGSF